MFGSSERIIDRLRLRWLLFGYVVRILLFGIVYYILPHLHPSSGPMSAGGEVTSDFSNALLFSFATATNSSLSEVVPNGHVKWLSLIEVSGGILFAGLAINLLAVMPSKKTRIAEKACHGWWVD